MSAQSNTVSTLGTTLSKKILISYTIEVTGSIEVDSLDDFNEIDSVELFKNADGKEYVTIDFVDDKHYDDYLKDEEDK